jgi:hypothetical protein
MDELDQEGRFGKLACRHGRERQWHVVKKTACGCQREVDELLNSECVSMYAGPRLWLEKRYQWNTAECPPIPGSSSIHLKDNYRLEDPQARIGMAPDNTISASNHLQQD